MVKIFTPTGWPEQFKNDEILLWWYSVIVPESLRRDLLANLHASRNQESNRWSEKMWKLHYKRLSVITSFFFLSTFSPWNDRKNSVQNGNAFWSSKTEIMEVTRKSHRATKQRRPGEWSPGIQTLQRRWRHHGQSIQIKKIILVKSNDSRTIGHHHVRMQIWRSSGQMVKLVQMVNRLVWQCSQTFISISAKRYWIGK